MFKYKGIKIIIKETSLNFLYFATKYKNTLLIYQNSKLSSIEKSKILHKAIRNAMG